MNIVAKDKRDKRDKERIAKYMMEQLEKEAEWREYELKVLDRMMTERSEINIARCKGRY